MVYNDKYDYTVTNGMIIRIQICSNPKPAYQILQQR